MGPQGEPSWQKQVTKGGHLMITEEPGSSIVSFGNVRRFYYTFHNKGLYAFLAMMDRNLESN